jgi:glucose/arabinose dehydrogenase
MPTSSKFAYHPCRVKPAVVAVIVILNFLTFALLCLAMAMPTHAELKLKQIATGFSAPVDLVSAGDDRLFVVEKAGRIRIIQRGSTTYSTFLDITGPVRATGGEQGLLGLAFAPNYATSGRFYVYYTSDDPLGAVTIARYTVSADPNVANTSGEVLLTIPHAEQDNHNGGGLRFGPDGMLYIAVGDGGGGGDPQCRGQDRGNFLGKLLRIDVSGASGYTVPPNNPLGTNNQPSAILAIGLRNPWRISFDRVNGDLYIGDVGQGAREEVNLLPAFNPASSPTNPINYGWPQREGLIAYNRSPPCPDSGIARTDPIFDYDHSNGDLSISGGYRYRGTRVPELASGEQYVYADFVSRRIWAATKSVGGAWTSRLLFDATFGPSAFGEDNRGELYVVGFGGSINRFTSTLGPSLDIDLNGSFNAATDGILLIRYLLGFRGDGLIDGAVGANANRSAADDIESYLADSLSEFDVDGASGVSVFRDGVLALRYLLGLPNAALTSGTGATNSAARIRASLDDLRP